MSGLAGLLHGLVEGDHGGGIFQWHAAFDVADVEHSVEHAGFGFAYVDGWTHAANKVEFLAAVGEALDFPEHYGRNYDALADCLRGLGGTTSGGEGGAEDEPPARRGVVLLWDGWSTLAREDVRAFEVVLDVLHARTQDADRPPFAVLLRGEGPDLPEVGSLD